MPGQLQRHVGRNYPSTNARPASWTSSFILDSSGSRLAGHHAPDTKLMRLSLSSGQPLSLSPIDFLPLGRHGCRSSPADTRRGCVSFGSSFEGSTRKGPPFADPVYTPRDSVFINLVSWGRRFRHESVSLRAANLTLPSGVWFPDFLDGPAVSSLQPVGGRLSLPGAFGLVGGVFPSRRHYSGGAFCGKRPPQNASFRLLLDALDRSTQPRKSARPGLAESRLRPTRS